MWKGESKRKRRLNANNNNTSGCGAGLGEDHVVALESTWPPTSHRTVPASETDALVGLRKTIYMYNI